MVKLSPGHPYGLKSPGTTAKPLPLQRNLAVQQILLNYVLFACHKQLSYPKTSQGYWGAKSTGPWNVTPGPLQSCVKWSVRSLRTSQVHDFKKTSKHQVAIWCWKLLYSHTGRTYHCCHPGSKPAAILLSILYSFSHFSTPDGWQLDITAATPTCFLQLGCTWERANRPRFWWSEVTAQKSHAGDSWRCLVCLSTGHSSEVMCWMGQG